MHERISIFVNTIVMHQNQSADFDVGNGTIWAWIYFNGMQEQEDISTFYRFFLTRSRQLTQTDVEKYRKIDDVSSSWSTISSLFHTRGSLYLFFQ